MAENKYEKMRELCRVGHGSQYLNEGKTPYWHHCEAVSDTLRALFEETQEASGDLLKVILIAANGHDLYEDTEITSETVIRDFGSTVHELIDGCTNTKGDDDLEDYMRKVESADERVRIIKMADLLENYTSGITGTYVMGYEWANSFLLPILNQMWERVRITEFKIYPKTAERLRVQIEDAKRRLELIVRNCEIESRIKSTRKALDKIA